MWISRRRSGLSTATGLIVELVPAVLLARESIAGRHAREPALALRDPMTVVHARALLVARAGAHPGFLQQTFRPVAALDAVTCDVVLAAHHRPPEAAAPRRAQNSRSAPGRPGASLSVRHRENPSAAHRPHDWTALAREIEGAVENSFDPLNHCQTERQLGFEQLFSPLRVPPRPIHGSLVPVALLPAAQMTPFESEYIARSTAIG